MLDVCECCELNYWPISPGLLPGCPCCCEDTGPPIPPCWPEPPPMVTCCKVGPPPIMGPCPGCPEATGPGGRHLESPFPKATAPTSALVSAGLKDGLFCRKAGKQKKRTSFTQSSNWSSKKFLTERRLQTEEEDGEDAAYRRSQRLCRHEDCSASPAG